MIDSNTHLKTHFPRAGALARFPWRLRSPLPLLSRRGRRRGAALVEFALVATLFLTMLLGMLQFGIYLSATNTLWNGAREGARLAAVLPASLSTTDADGQIRAQIIKTIAPLQASKTIVSVTPNTSGARVYGVAVTVRVSYDMRSKLFLPFPDKLFGRSLGKTYITYATMRKEN